MRTSNNTVIITGADLSPGHEYEVVVQAVSSQGLLQSPDDSPRAVIVLKGKETTPSQPSGLAALGGIVKISLTWDVQTDKDFDVMEIWRSPYDDFTTAVKVAEVKTTSWTDNLGSTGLTRYYWIRARNTSGKTSLTYPESGDSGISATTSGVTPTDIDDFAITATKLFTNTVILTGDTWTNNSPIAGSIAWNAHYIVFAGEYWQIPAGNTALRYVCWNQDVASGDGTIDDPYISQYVGYATYAYASGRFNIATNESGVAQLVWNASANMVIGSAFIMNAAIVEAKIDNLAVTDAKINSLTVAKLTAGTISSKEIVLSITAGTGDCAIRAGKTDFTNTESGFILGLDDSDSDKPKFYIGDATTYLNWDGAGLTIKGVITVTAGSNVEAGADVTSTHTAAAISGQGALATQDTADWTTDIASIPARLNEDDSPAATGVYITPNYIGFWDSGTSAWPVRIKNNAGTGEFFVGNAATSKYVSWDGSTMTVRGALNADDITAGTLTARTVQTASSNERIVLDASSNHLAGYDSGGTQVIDLDADDIMLKLYSGVSRNIRIFDGSMEIQSNADITGNTAAMLYINNDYNNQINMLYIDSVTQTDPTLCYCAKFVVNSVTMFYMRADGRAYFKEGATGNFTDNDGNTVHVINGLITSLT
jgi:hypothetical protein